MQKIISNVLQSVKNLHTTIGTYVKGVRDGATSEVRASPLFGKWATATEPRLQGWKQALSCHHKGSMESRCSMYRG